MIHSIQCVHCKAVLKVPAAIPSGKNVKCPKCQQSFIYEAPALPEPVEPPSANPGLPAAAIPNMDLDVPESDESKVESSHGEEQPQTVAKQDDEEIADELETEILDEEKPRSRKKRPRDDDDDEEDERRPKNKKSSYDEDEDEGDNRASKKKKKNKANNTKMMVMVLGGIGVGFVALICCLGCGTGGYFFIFMSAPDITGSWQSTNQFGAANTVNTYEFRKDGTLTVTTQHQVGLANFAQTRSFSYRVERGNPPVLVTQDGFEVRRNMELKGNELTLTPGITLIGQERLRRK